jgi:hypothetical protein
MRFVRRWRLSDPARDSLPRWSMGLHIAATVGLACVVAVTVLGLLWLLLGRPQVPAGKPLETGEVYEAIKIALAVVAGLGGVVALVVAYRKQRLGETGRVP